MRHDRYIQQLEDECARLTSGPGGIMEMKQTISDKEKRIEELEEAIRDLLQYVPRSDLYNVSPKTFAIIEST